jgi:hypothetical protein
MSGSGTPERLMPVHGAQDLGVVIVQHPGERMQSQVFVVTDEKNLLSRGLPG